MGRSLTGRFGQPRQDMYHARIARSRFSGGISEHRPQIGKTAAACACLSGLFTLDGEQCLGFGIEAD